MNKIKIKARKIKEFDIEVEAENEEKAMDIVDGFIEELDVFELDIPELISEYYELEPKDLEEDEDELDTIFENLECELCKNYCDKCGRCILEDDLL